MNTIILFLILACSFPIGYLLKYLTKEELKSGRKYFQMVWFVSLIIAIGMLFYPTEDLIYKQAVIFTLLFIANIAFISWK
ncbi:hypothetical protein COU53_00375 [Candidatus Pacearchaeota archaeon CG10_big_fil_rev_8_21_14_0_10_30_48]|nr:MAG: hypothetical protein COU53_00375 [Candidatus Pacearchaeota archaeon CG10_big_fil_rev_8_21_14_0_10_30_48]